MKGMSETAKTRTAVSRSSTEDVCQRTLHGSTKAMRHDDESSGRGIRQLLHEGTTRDIGCSDQTHPAIEEGQAAGPGTRKDQAVPLPEVQRLARRPYAERILQKIEDPETAAEFASDVEVMIFAMQKLSEQRPDWRDYLHEVAGRWFYEGSGRFEKFEGIVASAMADRLTTQNRSHR